MKNRQGLTDADIKALPAPATGYRIVYDPEVAGFGVRTTKSGAKSFILNYRAKGIERRLTIGSHPDWKVKAARDHAKALKREIDLGAVPMADRHTERAAPTINDLADRFEMEHLAKRRPNTASGYKVILSRYVRPELGKLKVADVRHRDIEALHRKISASKPYQANRVVAVVSKMMALAVKWEMRGDNPAKGIERASEEKRERFLSQTEISALAGALDAHPERTSANAVRLLLLTGARKQEVLGATWDQFDLVNGVWTKPAATTKQNKMHRVPLSAPARALLVEMKAAAETENARRAKYDFPPLPWVFPSLDDKPLGDIKHFWASVCRTAGIENCRLHDLRHTFASVLASSGLSLPVIGALLGHTQAQTTHRYAHLLDDPLRAATERVGALVSGQSVGPAEVVTLKVRHR